MTSNSSGHDASPESTDRSARDSDSGSSTAMVGSALPDALRAAIPGEALNQETPNETPQEVSHEVPQEILSDADAAIVDALVNARFDPESTPEPCRPHARRVAALLGGLDANDIHNRDTLADVILLQVARDQRRLAAVAAATHELSPQDANALDAMVMNGWEVGRVPRGLRTRASALDALLDTISTHDTSVSASESSEAGPSKAGSDSNRIDRIFNAIDHHEADMGDRMRLPTRLDPPQDAGRRLNFRLSDIGAVAAVLLVAYGLLSPVMNAGRQYASQAACSATMGGIGQALASYVQGNADSLPLAAPRFDRTWWGVGQGPEQSNAANLFLLHRTNYRSVDQLACHGNPDAAYASADVSDNDWRSLEQVSFSYRLPVQMNGRLRLRSAEAAGLNPAQHPIIADRSPVILRAVAGQPIDPFATSPNHNKRSMGVLMGDGAVLRLEHPVLENGDNIWLPRPIEVVIREVSRRAGRPIAGNELPEDGRDTFLGP